MMTERELDRLCHMLACRTNPSWGKYHKLAWTDFVFNSKKQCRQFKCGICNEIIADFDSMTNEHTRLIYEHGLNHIKEKNLLPFI